jgi:hypothetical protein
MQDLLTRSADRIALETGFVRRRRKVSGSNFARTLVFAALADSQPTENRIRSMASIVGLEISRQALTKRLNDRAIPFLRELLATAVKQAIASPVAIPLLQRFTSIVVLDSSVVSLPNELADIDRGGRSRTTTGSTAAVKFTLGLDLVTGGLLGPELCDGRTGDLASPLAQADPPAGGLQLADMNYFSLAKFARWHQAGAFWLSRLKCKTAVYDERGVRIDLVSWLRQADHADVDHDVALGSRERIACRLIARRVPAEVAALRRQRLLDKSADRGDKASPLALALCDWTVLVTNVPREKLTVEEAIALGRMRWQIELMFKLWKSSGGIDEWRGDQPSSTLCQFYSKLLAQVVRHWIVVVGAWSMPDRSMWKAAEVVEILAVSLAAAMRSLGQLKEVLKHACQLMQCVARMERRKKTPNANDLILCLDPGA